MLERLLITLVLILLGVGTFALFQRVHLRRATHALAAVGKPTIVYFRSEMCAPCAAQGRFLQQLQAEFGERIAIEKVEADVETEKVERYGVFTVPTTLIVDARGVVRHANYGLADLRKLVNQLRAIDLGTVAPA